MVGEPFEAGLFLCWCWTEPAGNGKWLAHVRFARKSDYSRPQPAVCQQGLVTQFDSAEAARQAAREYAIRRAHADAVEI